MLVLSHIELN